MFCATLLVSGQCLLACGGLMQEFRYAWNWPASFRWDNSIQAPVDDYGTLPQLLRRGEEAIWSTPAEPTYCAGGHGAPSIAGTQTRTAIARRTSDRIPRSESHVERAALIRD